MNNQKCSAEGDASETAHRRSVLKLLAVAGLGTGVFRRALAQQVTAAEAVTTEMIRNAEWIAGIELTEPQREAAARELQAMLRKRDQLRRHDVDYDVLPALRFDPEMFVASESSERDRCPVWLSTSVARNDQSDDCLDDDGDNLLCLSIRQLGRRLREGKITSRQLTELCLDRLRSVNPRINCVVTYTEELALQQADHADRLLAEGNDLGPLHGIPWGAKDLIAVADYPTTWGAPQFENQMISQTATVARKLETAGAVLVAKLSLGALAMGDRWFRGQTRNPWNEDEGSSGSSAGSAAAVAAGAVPFALGSETLGSIVSPCRRCGVTGLRPTFGRVSRNGCMSLSWSMDKIGPIARRVDDCALVFAAIHGADREDPTTVQRWFEWPAKVHLSSLRIGKVENSSISTTEERLLQVLTELGATVVSMELPEELPEWAISLMLDAEAATVFHNLIVSNNAEGINQWGDIFRKMHFFTAVDYLHAARLRSELMKQMAAVFENVNAYVGGGDLGICNLTGHPTVVLPVAMSEDSEHPQPICATITGRLHDEATLLAIAAEAEQKLGIAGRTAP